MSKRTALRTAPALHRRRALMATAAVVALVGLPMGPAWADPGAASPEAGGPAVAGGVARLPRGEDVVREPQTPAARLPRGESVVREPQAVTPLPPVARNALPRDPNVVAGGATFAEDGSRLDINQSTDRVVIDWRSFDIGQGAEVNFFQPGTSSIAVNRISQGGLPSQIQGILRANGTVVILNPNGVIFSATSRVDVGGLVASTGRMDVSQFMAGGNRLNFTDATSGEIVMGGSINIADAGLAAFVAPHVRNDGVINARLGRVALAAGETFTLDLAGDRLIELGLGAHSPLVENFGSILVDGGRVQLSAVAAGAVVDQVINAGGLISVASARAEGGTIVLEGANGGVTVSGELNASGATGGGDITLGGATVQTTAGAVLRADATNDGDGGSIVSMADGKGTYAGTLSARGGVHGGDGGFIETSGKTVSLNAGLRVDTTAADGVNGSWSIDPTDLVVGAGEAAAVVANLSTTNVVLQAQNSITIDSLIDSSAQGNNNTLSLNDEGGVAGLTVNLNAAIRLGANQRLLGQATQINIRNGGVIQNGIDVALANAGILISAGDYAAGATINKNGLTLTGEAGARIVLPTLASGVQLNGLTINADNVTVQGLEIAGPVDQSWRTYGWNGATTGGISRGIFAMVGADNFTIANNNIHDVRNGILVDGRNAGGSITGNVIDNTKSGVSVQYTDAGLLNAEGFTVNIAGNSEGAFGNEWGFNFHLNGHQTPGGLVGNADKIAATASTPVQQALLAVAAANGGMSAQDQGYSFANRTSVNVGIGGNDANQGSFLGQLATIQGGINAVVNGGKVNVGAGTFVQPTGSTAYLWVNKSVEIAGAGQGQTIIDARGASTYGIRVQADNVSLHDFTLWGVAASGNTYGIKVEPLQTGPNNPNARLLNFALSNVTIQGSGKTELDLNGVVGATIANVTTNGMAVGGSTITAGNGISITDSANITLTGVTTLNNGWGGLALYQTNKTFNQQVNNISVNASNTFNEANGIYLEDQSDGGVGSVVGGVGLDYGALNIAGYDYIVSDRSNLADIYTWFQRDQASALSWLGLTGRAATGTIEGWSGTAGNNVYSVGVIGSTAMSINAAIQAARSGGTINVGAGDYAGLITIAKSLTLSGAGMDQTRLTGGISLSNTPFSNLTLQGFALTGDGGGNALVRNGRVTNLTVDHVRFDGGNVAGRHGFAGGQFGGNISITNSEFLNIRGFSAFDTSTGGTATAITNVVFSNNLLDGTVGHVTFRQATPTANVLISGNTVRNVGDTTDLSSGIFKVFGGATVDFIGNQITGVGASPTKFTAGVNDGAALIVRGVGTLNITNNAFTDNRQAFLVGAGNALPTVTNITGNTFNNNAYDIFLPASTGGTLNFGAGNNFISGANTVAHLVWVGSTAVDMTSVRFNGELGSAMSNTQLFALEDRIYHGVDLAGSGLVTVKAGHLFATATAGNLGRAINLATGGDTVNIGNGVHVVAPGGYINIDKSLTLVGQSQAGVIIDARGASTYGIRVTADNNVSLSNFTLYGVTASGGYGIKAEEVTGLTLANITSQGAFKAEFDLNGVINATLTNLTANGASVVGGALTGGAGIAITDSQHVTLTGVTTLNNAWGGLALYQSNKPTGYLTRMDDINVGLSNTFNEQNGIYAEDESALHDFGTLNIAGYDYVAGNQSNPADTYLWFQKTLAGAMGILDATGTAGVGYIEGWTGSATNNIFNVGVTAGGTTMSINAALQPADQGAVINVAAGTYSPTVQLSKGVTLAGAGIGQTNLTGGILMSGTFSDLTLKNFTVTGNAGGNFVVQGGQVTNLTVDGVRIDAQSVAGRHGFGSGQYGGALSITNSQFANIDGWVVFDTRSGSSGGSGTLITSALFSNNTIDNSHGNVAFRQQPGVATLPNIVIANNTVTNVGNATNSFGAVFKVFNANTVDFTGNSVSGVGTSGFNPAGEAAYGAVLMTRDVQQLNITGNTFANNNQVLAIEPGRGLSTNTFLAGNTFNNNRYSIYMPGNALAGGAVTFGAGNNFIAGANTVQHIVWRNAGGLDLTGVAFDGKLGSAMTLGELFDLEDLISHGTDVAGVGLARVKAGEVFVTTGSGSIQRGLDVAAAGNTVHVDQGSYVTPGTLLVSRSVNLVGAGSGLTVIDASQHNSYGIRVLADDISLSGFSLLGSSAVSSATYGIKVETTDPDPAARRRNFSIADVAISGSRKTGLDLNGVVGAIIDGVTVSGTIAGNGISITDSADVTVRNTTTSGNAWGGLALYQTNAFHDQQVDNILIAASNVFGEAAGLYTQDSSATLNFGNLTIEGMGFTVRNDAFRPDGAQFTFYKASLQNALDYGVGLGAAASYVQGWNGSQGDDHFYVGGGDAGAGQQFLSIQTAFDKSSTGSVIDIFSGAYTGVSTLTGQRDLRFGVVTLGGLNLTSGASGTVISGDITATGGLDFDGTIILGGDTRLAADGEISLTGVDGQPGGQQALDVEGQGLVYVGQVGASVALASLSVVGSDVTVRGATTTGGQTFTGDTVMLWGGFDAGGNVIVSGPATLGGDTAIDSDSDIQLGSIDGEYNLSINAAGAVDVGAIGAVEALNGLNVLGAAITSHGAATQAGQSWNAATVGLSGAYAAGGEITVNGAANLNGSTSLTSDDYVELGSVDGAHDLTIQAATFANLGQVGGTTALVDLVVEAGQITAVGARTTGSQAFSGARVGLSGAFIAGGDFLVDGATDLDDDVAIDGDDVTLGSVDGAYDLTIDADGAVSLGAVGSDDALASLDVSGVSIASHGAITSGSQLFQAASVGLSGDYTAGGDFAVNGATNLTDDTFIEGDDVTLGSVNGAHDLAIDADGAVNLGAVGSTTALASLDVIGASIASHGAVTTGSQIFEAASIGLSGGYAAGGDFTADGATSLTGDVAIEGDDVTLASVNGAHDLTIGAAGAVSLGAVGSTTALASLDVSGASIASHGAITSGSQLFNAASVGLSGAYTAGGDFAVNGATNLTGDTLIDGDDVTLGSVNGAHDLTVAADGAVSLGAVGSTTALTSLDVSGASIASHGAITSGDQSYGAGTVGLAGAYAAGGDLVVDGASVLTGDASLDADGNVVLGTVNGAHSLSIDAVGSASLGAVGGTAALTNLDVTAATIASHGAVTTGDQSYDAATVGLSGLYAAGDDFTVDGAAILNGATSIDADAVVMGTVNGARHLSIAADGAVSLGVIGATTALTGLDVTGASIAARGARTIGAQSWTGQAIRLAGGFATDNGAFSLIGLTTLDGATTIATNGGAVVAGAINGASAGGQSLSINAGGGTASVGSMGAGVRLGAVLVRSAGTVLTGSTYAGSSLSFLGSGVGSTVRVTQAVTTFNSAPTGAAAGAIVVQPDLIGTANGAQSVVFNAGSGVGANNGDITLGNVGSQALRLGAMTVSGDDFSAQTVKLAGNFTSVLSGNQVFSANTLDTLASVNSKVGGNDSGPVVAGGSVTLATAGASSGSIVAGGPVSVVAGGAVTHNIASAGAVAVASTGSSVTGSVQSGGAVSVVAQGAITTNVTTTGSVAVTSTAGSVTGSIQGGAGVAITAQGPITATVSTPGAVTVTSPKPVVVNVNAGSVVVNAPGGKVEGTFGTITTDPNGTINVNGQQVVGSGSTDARQILVDKFLAPAGGVVGSNGLIQLPVNLAVALIAPAGEGRGNRRPVVVNSIDRLGELLRLGYTAIIVQLDSGEDYEQEIDLAAGAETQPAG